MLKLALFITIIFGLSTTISAQKIQFKTYKDTVHNFSFDIPTYWTIIYSKDQDGIICIPTIKAQKDIYKDCFEGIVFRMDFNNYGLDSLLFQQFDKIGDNYVTSDRIRHDVPVKFIEGKNWKGIRHDNICGISCKYNGFHAAGGECQFIYFCKGNMTIEIQTNGLAFDEKILTRLISSFIFTE